MSSKNDLKLSKNDKANLLSLAKRGDQVARAIVDALNDRLLHGGLVKAPTTASTQATGEGATVWRVDVDHILAILDGATKEVVATEDLVIHDTTQLVEDGQSCIAAIVFKVAANGVASLVAVKGDPATTGEQVPPTDADIQAVIGDGLSWLKIAECTLNRTGDTTVTQTQDNTKRDVGPYFA